MGGRGSNGKLNEKNKQGRGGSGGGNAGGGSGNRHLTDNQRRGNDDFTVHGVGDKVNVVGQHKRGRKPKEK